MKLLTRRQVEEAERLAAAATEGPWIADSSLYDEEDGVGSFLSAAGDEHIGIISEGPRGLEDGQFIAHSRTFTPAAAATIRALVEALREHAKIPCDQELFTPLFTVPKDCGECLFCKARAIIAAYEEGNGG